ncbi:MAG TPA: TonB-dependent receptor, partial [Sphingobacterium sp.]|nr:TonB-dependent receptor [Sphingobacterium sp.]
MKKIFFTLTLFILSGWAMLYGQGADTVTVRITGTVMSDIDETVSHVLIYLMDSTKTQLLKTETLDEKGRFVFENVLKGTYSITLERSERLIYSGETFEVSSDFVIPSIILKAETRQIEEVIVTKTKPFIERKDGMMILNMESNITSAGNSAFEVLEKAPGVHVDNNDNISLRGKSGVVVQIDGKTTPISGVQLATYLQSLPAENVDKIELITNPGAKYDASGTAIINIKMKKDRRSGTNGSISTAYGQGRYPKSNNSFALNHNYKKWNVFGNYGFAYREGFNELKLDRKFYNVGTFIGAYDQHNYLKMDFKSHVGRAGTDFSVNERHTLGIVVNAVSNKFNHT